MHEATEPDGKDNKDATAPPIVSNPRFLLEGELGFRLKPFGWDGIPQQHHRKSIHPEGTPMAKNLKTLDDLFHIA